MNYQDQELLDALAVDFILGAMKGAARKRFQRLMMANTQVRKTVWRWEQHLNPLAESLPATTPNNAVCPPWPASAADLRRTGSAEA